MTNFENSLRDALRDCTDEQLSEFFDEKFLKPLTAELDNTTSEVPADTIRHKRQQTNNIKNIFLKIKKST